MNSHSVNIDLEPVIWARLIQAQTGAVSPEVAHYLLSIEFGEADRARMSQLADRSEAGTLTSEERGELDGYLHIGNLLAVMQSKARVAMGRKPPRARRS
jgi:hypothetical protein